MILLGGGAALIVTSLVIPQGEPTGFQIDPISGGFYEGHKNDGVKSALGITGVVSMLSSIPFFIASGKNKKRANAISASLKTDNVSFIRDYRITRISYPALSLKFTLN